MANNIIKLIVENSVRIEPEFLNMSETDVITYQSNNTNVVTFSNSGLIQTTPNTKTGDIAVINVYSQENGLVSTLFVLTQSGTTSPEVAVINNIKINTNPTRVVSIVRADENTKVQVSNSNNQVVAEENVNQNCYARVVVPKEQVLGLDNKVNLNILRVINNTGLKLNVTANQSKSVIDSKGTLLTEETKLTLIL